MFNILPYLASLFSIPAGYLIAVKAKEELSLGKRWFVLAEKCFFVLIVVFMLIKHPLFLLLAVALLLPVIARLVLLLAILLFFGSPLLLSVFFIYGILVGTLLKINWREL